MLLYWCSGQEGQRWQKDKVWAEDEWNFDICSYGWKQYVLLIVFVFMMHDLLINTLIAITVLMMLFLCFNFYYICIIKTV